MPDTPRSVALVTLGCTRNEVDSEELAGRLSAEGWLLVDDAAQADVAVINTCGFIAQAKKDSIDTVLEAADLKENGRTQAVVAVGCLAERYGSELAAELPEADAVLGFDSYADMSTHLRTVLDGGKPEVHAPGDRRTRLPLSPIERQAGAGSVVVPGHGDPASHGAPVVNGDPTETGSVVATRVTRARLDGRPWAPLKIASGCDRRCAFCAIPMFRGSFISRRPTDIVAEARWLAQQGVTELFLVSENSTSYGKDLGDLDLLQTLLPELAAIEGIEWVRVSYLQPAEIRPGLLEAMAATEKVVPWFDISFQHASGPLLRRMRRFGDAESFLDLIQRVRTLVPQAGLRANVIVGFPGETDADVAVLEDFLTRARLDVVGVFGYSDEDGTEGETLDGKVDDATIAARVQRLTDLVEELSAQRAADRVGQDARVLIEEFDEDGRAVGRAAHQGPEVDGVTYVTGAADVTAALKVGDYVDVRFVDSEGIDLVGEVR
ncbi:30S ribosomal protein S12 methylthiotransferase RimO [Kribbia dieselivorans]|uniref:30S ribosomal protein S12 methylthiotransferase RimO n=1 Tax=Kribbia dieselivorans TaxID=331526 RepID=UPI000838718A|nr:30S ribosomal protein S12 methylthiotransferase RimO [Kribbia dieselivorans]